MSFKHEPVLEISAEPDVLQIEYRPENHEILTLNDQTSVYTRNSENSQRSRGSQDLEIPKLHAVVRVRPTSKFPILVTKENGLEFRCRMTSGKHTTVWYTCNRRSKYNKCPFSMKIQMVLTKNYLEENFWEIANWKILKVMHNHTCHTYTPKQMSYEKYFQPGGKIKDPNQIKFADPADESDSAKESHQLEFYVNE